VAEKKTRSKSDNDDAGRSDGTKRKASSGGGVSGAQIAKRARKALAEITGLEAESVTSLDRSDDGGWNVTVELLELARVPETDDVLGAYETQLDEDGELLGYRRVSRYSRSQSSGPDSTRGG